MGLLFAVANTVGEHRFGNALNAKDQPHAFLSLERAEAVWPLKFRIREGQTMAYSNTGSIAPELALEALDSGLKNDPYSPSMLWHKAMQELRQGRTPQAWTIMKEFEKVSNNWLENAELRKLYRLVRTTNYSYGRE